MSLSVFVRRFAVNAAGAAVLAASGSLLLAQAVPVNNPPVAPRSILVFPQRDFVSSSGFEEGDLVTVEVFHPGATQPASSATNAVPQDDPATPTFDGIVEVNHPGGVCWEGVTPDIRPGDRVRTTRRNAVGSVVGIDETTVANVKAKRPVQTGFDTVAVHGTAQNADGTPIDITQLEQRLVAPRDAFDLNGRRTLRATSVAGASEGVLVFDAPGSLAWTATYSGLSAADVTRALNAESRIMWLGTAGGTLESTIYENGAAIIAGPSAPCAAPLEVLPPPPGSELVAPSTPTNLDATLIGTNGVGLTWADSTDNVGVTSYGIYRNGIAIANVQHPDGSAPAPTSYQDLNVPAGTYSYTVDAADEVGNRSAQSAPVSITTTTQNAADFPLCAGAPTAGCVAEPPAATPTQVQIIAFPARDFTSSSGYTADVANVAVQVIRSSVVISTASVIPVDDPTTPGFDGVVEVNHPGGGCWAGVTPDLRANDIVRQIAYAHDGSIVRVDQTHVSNISVERPTLISLPSTPTSADGAVEVHGTAMAADGSPIPLAQITQRLVAPRDRFDFNGRRTLRAGLGEDFQLAYDTVNNPTGTKFTAYYNGLNETDVYRVIGGKTSTGRKFDGAESRILFLGLPTVIAPEITIYENSDLTISGPAAGACSAPMELLDTSKPTTPATVLATRQAGSNSVHLTWDPSTDDTYVNGYGVYRDGVRIRNVGPSVVSFDDVDVVAGDHTYAVDAVDSASPLKVNFPPIQGDTNASDPILQGVEYGNRSAKSADVPVSQPDVLAPSVPVSLVGTAAANLDATNKVVSWTITVSWQPSTDNVGVKGYSVYRAGRPTVNTTAPTYSEVVPATTSVVTYTYAVDAFDAALNRSAQSASVSVSVANQVDTTKPSTPANLRADTRDIYSSAAAPALGARDVKLTWTLSTDNVGVAGYSVYRRAAASISPSATWTNIANVNNSTATYTDLNVALGTYDYTVDAFDSAANRSAQAAFAPDVATVNDPPTGTHAIIPFPQRDFVSSTGYRVTDGPVVISVIRNGKLWAKSDPIPVTEDPATPGFGIAEVNHPGGGCWNGATLNGMSGVTPDIRPGDIVRVTNRFGVAEETPTANVYADRATTLNWDGTPLPAGTVQIHGWAQSAGKPLPIDQIEQRLIASSAAPFSVNGGRRSLRALGDGTIAYDAIGPANPNGIWWTATYSGLPQSDVDLALAAESRAVWLGRAPLSGNELTFFENGDGIAGGPAAGFCTAPAEAGPAVTFAAAAPFVASYDPGALTIAFQQQDLGKPVTQTLTVQNFGTADPTRQITGAFVVGSGTFMPAPIDFKVSTTCGLPGALPSNACNVAVTFTPVRTGVQSARLVLIDNANNNAVQIFTVSGEGLDLGAPTVTAPAVTFAAPAVVSATAVSTVVTASAVDFSGVASMTLEQSLNGGAWTAVTPVTVVTTTGNTPATLTANAVVPLTGTYQFRVTATDALGHKSAPVASPLSKTTLTDDPSLTFIGSWSSDRNSQQDAGTIGSSLHWTSAPQPGKPNTATWSFTGTEAALVSSRGPDRGLVGISVDGGAVQVIDLYAPTLQKAVVVGSVSVPTSGRHTFTISVQTGKNSQSTGTRVDVDAVLAK